MCDGIGGTVKRLVARASLQATMTNQVLKSEQMFKWVTSKISGIKFFSSQLMTFRKNTKAYNLEARFSSVKTIPGTRFHHSFIPDGQNIQM